MHKNDKAVIYKYGLNDDEAEQYIERVGIMTAEGVDEVTAFKTAIKPILEARK
jgi:hypothetical protein